MVFVQIYILCRHCLFSSFAPYFQYQYLSRILRSGKTDRQREKKKKVRQMQMQCRCRCRCGCATLAQFGDWRGGGDVPTLRFTRSVLHFSAFCRPCGRMQKSFIFTFTAFSGKCATFPSPPPLRLIVQITLPGRQRHGISSFGCDVFRTYYVCTP